MYTDINFKSRKALKTAVAAGQKIGVFQPNDMFGNPKANPDFTGKASVEGPHYPKPHTWYAEVEITNGVITRVR